MTAITAIPPYTEPRLAISAWAEEDRPREKLILKGKHNLSNAELIAILLGSGARYESALGLAQRILQSAENDLQRLGKMTRQELLTFRGVGDAKAVTILAALELGRRRQLTPLVQRPQIRSSQDAYDCLAPFIGELQHEECWMLCMNNGNYVTHRIPMSSGGRGGTVVDPKLIFARAMELQAARIIVAHNHPSTRLQPSLPDRELTSKLFAAGKLLDLPLMDHLIISEKGYYSFADDNQMK
ncbi:MAG: DNA repair protein RadC [Bacteroidota bacterium]